MSKSSQVEKEKRIFTIQGWIIDGVQDYLILKQVHQNWGIGIRQARRYVAEAYQRWKSDETISIDQRRSARIAELQQDIRSMGDEYKKTPTGLRTMLAFKKELSKLEDLYPARKIQLSGDVTNPVRIESKTDLTQLSDEVLEAIVAAQKKSST